MTRTARRLATCSVSAPSLLLPDNQVARLAAQHLGKRIERRQGHLLRLVQDHVVDGRVADAGSVMQLRLAHARLAQELRQSKPGRHIGVVKNVIRASRVFNDKSHSTKR